MDTPKHRVLIVDDDERIRRTHARLFKSFGYDIETAADGIEALSKLPLDIDLVILDAEMPHVDGFEVARRIRSSPATGHVPIMMVTGLTRPEDHARALEVGINDFITKPVDASALELRARWLVEFKSTMDALKEQKSVLVEKVEQRTAGLRSALEEMAEAQRDTYEAHLDTIRRLTLAAEYKDKDTAGHIERVGRYCEIVTRALGLAPQVVEIMRHAAPMHDVGKLGIPDAVLLKPGSLSAEEWVVMRSHTEVGAHILDGSRSEVIRMGKKICLSHHEKWDGSGYPNGLSGEDIALEGRICAVVDVFDALTMDRPYRKALERDAVYAMIAEDAGSHFDPAIVDVFFGLKDHIEEIHLEYLDCPTGLLGSANEGGSDPREGA